MTPVDPVEFAPLAGCQRAQKHVVHDFRPGAKPALAIVQARAHPLQLGHNGALNLFQRHSPRSQAFRSLAAFWHIPEIHHQERGHALLPRSPSSQRSTLSQAFVDSAIGVLVSEEQVLQNLARVPLSRRSVRQGAGAGTPDCIFEFLPQTFKRRIHGSSVQ